MNLNFNDTNSNLEQETRTGTSKVIYFVKNKSNLLY